jgi:hypothetical protein
VNEHVEAAVAELLHLNRTHAACRGEALGPLRVSARDFGPDKPTLVRRERAKTRKTVCPSVSNSTIFGEQNKP